MSQSERTVHWSKGHGFDGAVKNASQLVGGSSKHGLLHPKPMLGF